MIANYMGKHVGFTEYANISGKTMFGQKIGHNMGES